MDMKRILQAMDGVATKPVAGANDMAKFLSVIDKNNVEILNEASNPHKVTLPVQMAMQHYQQPPQIEKKKFTNTGIRKFFHDVEQEIAEEQTSKQQLLRQYSQTIAERVLMREFKERDDDDNEHAHKLNTNKLSVKANRFLQQAHQMSPGDEGDIEAMAAAASELADTAKQQQVTIDRQMDMYVQLQDLLTNTEKRFRDLNAKVASGEITDQDAAVAAQEIERDHDTGRKEIAKDHTGNVEPEKLKRATEPVSQPEPSVTSQPKSKSSVTKTPSRPVQRALEPEEPATSNAMTHMANQLSKPAIVNRAKEQPNTSDALAQMTSQLTQPRARAEMPATVHRAKEQPAKSYSQNLGSVSYSVPTASVPATTKFPYQVTQAPKPATAPATRTPTNNRYRRNVNHIGRGVAEPANTSAADSAMSKITGKPIKATRVNPVRNMSHDELVNVFEEVEPNMDNNLSQQPPAFTPSEPEEPAHHQHHHDHQPVENGDVIKNTETIKSAFAKYEPMADIYFGGRGVTVYISQMYALSATLANIKDPRKREERKHQILGSHQGWLEFIQARRTRQWIGHYTNWYKDQLKKQKKSAQAVGQKSLPLPMNEVRKMALDCVAVKEGFPNWQEARKILDDAEFTKLIKIASVLAEHYQTRELSHAKVLSTGPGPQDNVLGHDGRDQLGLEETPSTMDRMKRYRMIRRIARKTGWDLSHLELASDDELHQMYTEIGLKESPIYDQPDRDVHNPDVSYDKSNTHPLETVINMANHDILRLADDVNSMKTMSLEGKLLVWQRMAQEFTTGGVMQTLAGRAAQIAHGIAELKKARQTGAGIAPKRRSKISRNLE